MIISSGSTVEIAHGVFVGEFQPIPICLKIDRLEQVELTGATSPSSVPFCNTQLRIQSCNEPFEPAPRVCTLPHPVIPMGSNEDHILNVKICARK